MYLAMPAVSRRAHRPRRYTHRVHHRLCRAADCSERADGRGGGALRLRGAPGVVERSGQAGRRACGGVREPRPLSHSAVWIVHPAVQPRSQHHICGIAPLVGPARHVVLTLSLVGDGPRAIQAAGASSEVPLAVPVPALRSSDSADEARACAAANLQAAVGCLRIPPLRLLFARGPPSRPRASRLPAYALSTALIPQSRTTIREPRRAGIRRRASPHWAFRCTRR